MQSSLWTLFGLRLGRESCLGDVIIEQFKLSFPLAFDRHIPGSGSPTSNMPNFLTRLREELESDQDSPAGGIAGWAVVTCQSPGRRPLSDRRQPDTVAWRSVGSLHVD